MQKVELYNSFIEAKYDMQKHINQGWKIHTCSVTSCVSGYNTRERTLVIYEKGE